LSFDSWLGTRDEVIINKSWQTLAESNNLNFTPGRLLEGFRVFGNYQGYTFGLMAFRKDGQKYGTPHTGLVLIRDVQVNDGHSTNNEDEVEQSVHGLLLPGQSCRVGIVQVGLIERCQTTIRN
jgi:hypothetical protein